MNKKYEFSTRLDVQIQGKSWNGAHSFIDAEIHGNHNETLDDLMRELHRRYFGNFEYCGIASGEIEVSMYVYIPDGYTYDGEQTWTLQKRITKWFDIRNFSSVSTHLLPENKIKWDGWVE